jgi:hypothetical protein
MRTKGAGSEDQVQWLEGSAHSLLGPGPTTSERQRGRAGETISTKWALLKTIQQEPADNPLACYAMADLLEEGGWLDLAFCYRWMGWYGRRPGKREGPRLRKRFVWYKEAAFVEWPSDESDRYDRLPHAWLAPLVYQSLQTANQQFQLYSTWEQAVNDLAKGLARLRALLGPPAEKQGG